MSAINDILAKANITLYQLAYVGDDIVDLGVIRQCGLTTANARAQIKAVAHYTTPAGRALAATPSTSSSPPTAPAH